MARLLPTSLATVLLACAVAQAQTPEPQPPRPRAGTIIESPNTGTGRITDAPGTARPSEGGVPAPGQTIERFEAVGNGSVASDTIRVYLGVVPGDPYNPEALQRNFLNLWQTGDRKSVV